MRDEVLDTIRVNQTLKVPAGLVGMHMMHNLRRVGSNHIHNNFVKMMVQIKRIDMYVLRIHRRVAPLSPD